MPSLLLLPSLVWYTLGYYGGFLPEFGFLFTRWSAVLGQICHLGLFIYKANFARSFNLI